MSMPSSILIPFYYINPFKFQMTRLMLNYFHSYSTQSNILIKSYEKCYSIELIGNLISNNGLIVNRFVSSITSANIR